jgi:hypothetical protein
MRDAGTGPQTPITVLMAPGVQKELKLTDAQKTKVFGLSVSASQKQRDHFQSAFLSGGLDPQAMMAARDNMRRDNEQAVAKILDETQKERFNQIVLRAEGPLAVARPEIASKLKLNGNQREYVQSIMMQMQRNQFMLFMRLRQSAAAGQAGPGQFAQLRGMMADLRGDAVSQLGKVIDAKQKAAFNKMLGEPFDLTKLDTAAATDSDDPATPSTKEEAKAGDKDDPAPKSAAKGAEKPARKKGRGRTTTKPSQ